MLDTIQLNAPARMLRETAMDIDQLLRLQADYSDRATATDAAVYDAATAVLRLECRSEPVIVALGNLATERELQHDRTEIERAERYVVECWTEYTPPTGIIYKAAL